MNMTTNKQALDAQARRMRNYLNTAVISGVKLLHLTTDELSGLLDELEAAERRNAELTHHLKSAHQFIEHTEAFGYMAASGILQCGDAKWDVDASKESLRAAATDKGELV